jgi:parallel beta-helix repeat protein
VSGQAVIRTQGVAAAGGLVLALAGLLVLAVVDRRAPTPAADAVAGVAWPGAAPPDRRVAFTGPSRAHGPTVLRARVTPSADVVAVTFRLDGRPLGTDTTTPYALDVDAGRLPRGRHSLRIEAVDRFGRRAVSRIAHVRTRGASAGGLVRGPGPSFGRALAQLARGHVTVRLGPGRYPVGRLRLGSGARLTGAGPGTVLVATRPVWALAEVAGRRVRLADLSLDGAGLAGRGVAVADGSADVRLQRLRIAGVRENGVEAWGAHAGVSVQDSAIDGGRRATAGVLDMGSERSRDVSVIRTSIRGFRGYGIDFVQRAYDRPGAAAHNLALDNRIADITDPAVANGTREGGIWSGGGAAAIVGNRIRDTGWDGIETVGSSTATTIVDNDIARTRVGIYLEHETNRSVIARNAIAAVRTGINAEWRYGGHGSSGNTLAANVVTGATETGVFIDVAGDRNRIDGNVVAGGGGPAIVLQGASDNVITGNRGCARGDAPLVVQRSAHHDDGVRADSLRNVVTGNRQLDSCAQR